MFFQVSVPVIINKIVIVNQIINCDADDEFCFGFLDFYQMTQARHVAEKG